MLFGFRFPSTNFHELNLDWIITVIKKAVFSINGITPDADGNVQVNGADLGAVATVNGLAPDSAGNVDVGTVKTVNSKNPDPAGNVNVGTVISVDGYLPDSMGQLKIGAYGAVRSVNNDHPDTYGNVNVGTVKSVNNTAPDSDGNVNLPTVAGVTSVCGIGPDGNGDVALGPTDVGAVATVNGVSPDSAGEVTLTPGDIGAVAAASSSGTVTWDATNTDTSYSGVASDYVVVNKVCYVYLRFKATTSLYDNMLLATGLPVPKAGTPGYMTATTTVSPSNTVRVRVNGSGQLTMYYAGVLNANDTVMLNSCYPIN